MREESAVFGGEVSGHYYFRDFSQADSGVVPFLLMLELISKRGQKLSEILRPFNDRYFITGELNTPVADVALKLQELKERFGPEGTRLAPGRPLRRLRSVAHERPAVEHGALAPPQPRGALARADGAQARRSPRRDPNVKEKPPFRFSAQTRVGFSDTDAQGIVYYGRYLPYFDLARVEYHRNLGLLGMDIGDEGQEFVMRACTIEYLAPAVFDDLIEVYVRMARIGRTSVTYELAAYRARDDELMVTATQTLVLVDLDERKAVPIPESYKARDPFLRGRDPRSVSTHSSAVEAVGRSSNGQRSRRVAARSRRHPPRGYPGSASRSSRRATSCSAHRWESRRRPGGRSRSRTRAPSWQSSPSSRRARRTDRALWNEWPS